MQFDNKTIRKAVKDWLSDSVRARSKWGPIEDWDVSQVTDINKLFYGATSFSADLSRWDVSRVTNMERILEDSGIFHTWGLTTLKDIPWNHAYRKASRIQSFGHLSLARPRMQSISIYI